MAIAVQMQKRGNARLVSHQRNQTLSTARDDKVDKADRGQQRSYGGAIGRVDHLNAIGREPRGLQTLSQTLGDDPG